MINTNHSKKKVIEIAQIYVPIDSSALKDILPPGEDIIYSALFKAKMIDPYKQNRVIRWKSHVLFTNNYVAFQTLDNYSKKKPLLNQHAPWGEINYLTSVGKLGVGFQIFRRFEYFLTRDEQYETKEKFKERSNKFVETFRPHLIEKKKEYLEKLKMDPSIRKKTLKHHQKQLEKMIQKEEKRLAKLN